MITDPDFQTQMTRATDYSMAGSQGAGFDMGSGGDFHYWSPDSSKLFVGNAGGAYALLSFNPSQWGQTPGPVTVSAIYGALIYGVPAFSGTNPHLFYTLETDQENTVFGTVTSGTCLTPETIRQTNNGGTAMSTVLAVNATFAQFGVVTGAAPTSTNTWVGQTSGCVFTPTSSYSPPPVGTSNTPYVNALYKATLNDATQSNPANWLPTYSLLFNFNYNAAMAGTPAASYYPTGPSSCLPANYNGYWNGVFRNSLDDSVFGAAFADNGQVISWGEAQSSCATSPGGVCTGPVYYATYTVGHGCRVYNTHSDRIAGDDCTDYPCGQASDGQRNYIVGTMTGTPTQPTASSSGGLLTQDVSGAVAEYKCTGILTTNDSPPSGAYTYNQFVCGAPSATAWEVGVVYGTPDATHAWRDGSGNSIVPSASPQPAPFYFPMPLHGVSQTDNPMYASLGQESTPNSRVLSEVSNGTTTTITVAVSGSNSSDGSVVVDQDQQLVFYNLTGSASYLNCTSANSCPVWTVQTGVKNGSSFSIADGHSGYTNSETTSACSMTAPSGQCPLYAVNGEGYNSGYSNFGAPDYWQIPTLIQNSCNQVNCQGHAASGETGSGRATYYFWFDYANPSLPCTVSGYSPCPDARDLFPLLSSPLPEDDHGSYNQHGLNDLTPVFTATTHVCGLAGGVGSNSCYSPYGTAMESEVIAVENSVTNNASGQCGSSAGPGCHCNYGSGPAACMYRFGHTFNSDGVWEFNAQNNIGNVSPDGQWFAFPSTWMDTLGCMNGATTCWASYIASGPPKATLAGATIQTNGSGVVTVTMPNQFCAPNGSQYYWTDSAVQTIACGSLAEQVTLSGFAETWANQTITLTAVGGCDSTDSNAGNCTSFSGTGSGIPSSYGPVTETGTQTATTVNCLSGSGVNTYCQRPDIWIAKLVSAH